MTALQRFEARLTQALNAGIVPAEMRISSEDFNGLKSYAGLHQTSDGYFIDNVKLVHPIGMKDNYDSFEKRKNFFEGLYYSMICFVLPVRQIVYYTDTETGHECMKITFNCGAVEDFVVLRDFMQNDELTPRVMGMTVQNVTAEFIAVYTRLYAKDRP